MAASTPKPKAPSAGPQVAWGEFVIPPDQLTIFQSRFVSALCKRVDDEVWLASVQGDYRSEFADADISWTRWVAIDPDEPIAFTPIFPDRPVVVQPEHAFKIAPGARTKIYVSLPMWLRIEKIRPAREMLIEVPTVVLSNTWFGSFTEGELCYWAPSPAARTIPDAGPESSSNAICPIQIINRAEEALVVDKIAIRVEHLCIFKLNGQFWSDPMQINYKGTEDLSRIEITGKVPAEARGATLLSSPRKKQGRQGFAAKTFATLRDLSGMGFIQP